MTDIASLGIKVTSDGVAKAESDLDKLASTGDRAAASTDKLAQSSAKASKAYASDSYRRQTADLAKLVGQIDPTVAALERLDAQQAKLNAFKKSGVLGGDDFALYSAKLDATRQSLSGYSDVTAKAALTTKQLAFSTRGIPAQFTDIATSLASGQRPLTVLLQQGGQLKDMFGGVGPAAKALGGYVLGLINPFTLGAAATVALALAWKSGSDEADALTKSLITTGSYAGRTSAQLADSAKNIASFVGTQHEAAAALAEVAGSGKFTADSIELVGKAALDMARITGQSTAETIKQFASLADDPVNAIVKLNESQHFLTDSVYEQIKALEDQGRAQDAADLAERAYAESIAERAGKVKESLGTLETAWNSVKQAAASAWDRMLDIGRPESGDDKLLAMQRKANALAKQLQELKDAAPLGGSGFGNLGNEARAKERAVLQAKLDDAVKAYHAEEHAQSDDGVAAQKAAVKQQANDMAIALAQQATQYESAEKKRADQITKAHGEANAAIAKAEAAGDKDLVAKIKASEATIIAGIQSREKKPRKAKQDPEINAYKTFSGQVDALDVRAITSDDPALTKYQQGIAKLSNELNTYMEKNGDATKAAALFNQGQQALQRTLDQDYKKQDDANAQYSAALDKKNAAIQLSIDNQVAQVSMGAKEYAQQQQIAKVYRDQADALTNLAIQRQKGIDGQSGGISKSQYDFDVDSVKKHTDEAVAILKNGYSEVDAAQGDWKNGALSAFDDIRDRAGNVAGQTKNFFVGAFDDMADSLATFATTGKLNFKSLAVSILSDLAKMEIKIAASQALQYLIGAVSGGGGDAGASSAVVANAKGGVYNSPSLAEYSGQIVNKPTMFAFAKGAGIMGEAGPEAIMPLSRGSNGKLGVAMHGGSGTGVNINVVVNVASDGSASVDASGDNQTFGKQFGDAMANAAKKVVAQEIRPGGQIYAVMGRK